jgi:hypothetical protein
MTVKKRPSDLTSLERFNLYYKEKEDPLTARERMKRFIWNPKTRQFCGRTGSSWCKYFKSQFFNQFAMNSQSQCLV